LLDGWCSKPRKSGKYSDIFDGDMCHIHLKAPNSTLFFSNLLHERQGPDGELRIGVNLGVDWCVLRIITPCVLTHFATGSLTYAATSPHHTHHTLPHFRFAISCLNIGVCFSIQQHHILILSYRYRTSNLMCTSILPGPKEQNPDEVQQFLRPIVSDLLRLWKDGIKVPTESRPEGKLYMIT
jgi:hypothetical protein